MNFISKLVKNPELFEGTAAAALSFTSIEPMVSRSGETPLYYYNYNVHSY